MGFEFEVAQPFKESPPPSLGLDSQKPPEVEEEDETIFTQEEIWGFQLDNDYDQIIEKKAGSTSLIKQYAQWLALGQRHQWNRMMVGLLKDEQFGPMIDQWKVSGNELFSATPVEELDQQLVTFLENEELIHRAAVLDGFLSKTQQLCTQNSPEALGPINEYWVMLYKHWKSIRLGELQQVSKESQSYISESRQALSQFISEEFPGFASNEGVERVSLIPTNIRNDFMLGFEYNPPAGCYVDSTSPFGPAIMLWESYARRGVKDLEFGYSFFGHEATHAFSGHGSQEKREKSNIGSVNHRSDVISDRRVGVGRWGKYVWLNEALTERLTIRFTEKQFNRKHESWAYAFERSLLEHLLNVLNIDEKELYRWYFTEGDDTDVVRMLSNHYPQLLPILEALELELEKQSAMVVDTREQDKANEQALFDIIDSHRERNVKQI